MKSVWIMIVMVALLGGEAAIAQKGLYVASLFDGRFRHDKHCMELLVKGKPLKPYGLTLFHSLTFGHESPDLPLVSKLVAKDAQQAVDKEEAVVAGRVSYGYYRFPALKNKRTPLRYLVYHQGVEKTILIYIEGYTRIEQLKKLFRK